MSDWIKWEWSEENPYPESLDTLVYVRFMFHNNWESSQARPVKEWGWVNVWKDKSPNDITHYKLVPHQQDLD